MLFPAKCRAYFTEWLWMGLVAAIFTRESSYTAFSAS